MRPALPAFASLLTVSLLALPRGARAAESPAAAGEASTDGVNAELETNRRGRPRLSKRKEKKWIRRWAPERNMVELGAYVGALFPASDTELFEPNLTLPEQGFQRFDVVAPEFGARLGYYPIRFLGLEAEGGAAPTATRDTGASATLWAVRGHLIGQLGLWSVTPFVLAGGGVLAVASGNAAVGNDIDQALHFGAGAKFFFNRWVQARIEFRDVVTPRRGLNAGPTNNLEVLLGLSFTFGRERDRQRAGDRDGDGFLDPKDRCPSEYGVAPDGCPAKDSDGDGFVNPDDRCPQEVGVAPDGCPAKDSDGDGFHDPADKCPQEPGIAPDGCPDADPDHDGILDPNDGCPTEPETQNGYQDDDGCPDQLPDEVGSFQGTLEGVYFDVNQASLRPQSKPTLDRTVEILNKYPGLRVEISGHSDSTGTRGHNMELSAERATAVKTYLTAHEIDAARIETRGAGPDEPIDSNQTPGGRAKNRRIEFRVLK